MEVEMAQKAKKHLLYMLFILLLVFGTIQAQEKKAPPWELTIDAIMEGTELVGTAPSSIIWSMDGTKLYFRWQKPGEKSAEFHAITKTNLTPQTIKIEDLLKLPPFPSRSSFSRYSGFFGMEIRFDKERKRALFTRGGDIYLLDIPSGKTTQLTATDERESGVNFTFDQEKISLENRLLRRKLWRLPDLDGHVQSCGDLQGRSRFKAGHGLGPLSSRLHGRHSQPPSPGHRGLQAEFSSLLCRGPQGSSSHLPRHGGHQCPFSGYSPACSEAHRAQEG